MSRCSSADLSYAALNEDNKWVGGMSRFRPLRRILLFLLSFFGGRRRLIGRTLQVSAVCCGPIRNPISQSTDGRARPQQGKALITTCPLFTGTNVSATKSRTSFFFFRRRRINWFPSVSTFSPPLTTPPFLVISRPLITWHTSRREEHETLCHFEKFSEKLSIIQIGVSFSWWLDLMRFFGILRDSSGFSKILWDSDRESSRFFEIRTDTLQESLRIF
jgi:hypothetical protein